MQTQLAPVAAVNPTAAPPRLTAQQTALLGLVAEGHPYTAIARRHGVSNACIHRWLTGIYRRLAARNAAHAVAIAIRAGLLPASDRAPLDRPTQPAWDHCGPGGISNPHLLHPGQTCDQYDAAKARR